MFQSILKGLVLGVFLALMPLAAFLLWLGSVWSSKARSRESISPCPAACRHASVNMRARTT
nr:hypothetical protein [Tepidimonas aquatica]